MVVAEWAFAPVRAWMALGAGRQGRLARAGRLERSQRACVKTDMSLDIRIHMCTDMCGGMHIDMCVDVYKETCVDICIDV